MPRGVSRHCKLTLARMGLCVFEIGILSRDLKQDARANRSGHEPGWTVAPHVVSGRHGVLTHVLPVAMRAGANAPLYTLLGASAHQ